MLKNMKIGKRLIVAFIMVALIASISGIISIFTTTSIDAGYGNALINYGFAQGDIGKAMLQLSDSRRAVRDIVNSTDQKYVEAAKADLAGNSQRYNEYASAVEKTMTTDETRALYVNAESAIERYRIKRDEIIKLGDTTDPEQSTRARLAIYEELDPLYQDLYNAWAAIMDLKVNYGQEQSAVLSTESTIIVIFNIVIVCVAVFVAVLIGIFISKGISRPVRACAERLVALSQGDLHTVVPEATSGDEIGVMLGSLKNTTDFLNLIISDIGLSLGEMAHGNLMIDSTVEFKGDFNALKISLNTILMSLNDTLGQINVASDQVSSGSDQVSSGAQALSQGATEQASSVEELAATISEISHQVKNNADNAINASQKSGIAGDDVVESNKKMQELIIAMEEISNSSQEIGKVIKTIEDIAFQTNILALNAAVEAARAGAAGKGFAVVADEVRNLASKSAEAAQGTTVLIEGAIKAVANGTQLVDVTAKSLLSVVKDVQEVAALVDKISAASNEQASSIAQVTQGIDQISAVVQTNSATAEESAAASEELSGQAQMLKQLVGKFKLKGLQYSTTFTHPPTAEKLHEKRSYISGKY